MGVSLIKSANSEKFLSVNNKSNLTLKKHLKKVCKKASKLSRVTSYLRKLSRVTSYMTIE